MQAAPVATTAGLDASVTRRPTADRHFEKPFKHHLWLAYGLYQGGEPKGVLHCLLLSSSRAPQLSHKKGIRSPLQVMRV